jgi:Family of unknown function (DUF6295)
VCTYQNERVVLKASAKGGGEWFAATDANVYFDHPVHFCAGHALMIDVLNPSRGAACRVALEMDATSARDLALAILRALDTAPTSLLDEDRR